MRRLAEKAEMKQSFLENINHEIRTPLNAIIGFSRVLATERDLGEDSTKQFMDFIEKNNEKLLQIIDNILLISQLESGEIKLKEDIVSANDILDDIYEDCKDKSSDDVAIIVEKANCDCKIIGDRRFLTKAIQHFVENGLKFTDKGHVRFGCNENKTTKEVEFFIEDTGRGIDKDERKMIFKQFYKEDRFSEGTGLGLTISTLIIEKSHGTITLKSEKGNGSCFTITFPLCS
jgi:signal transduction histidine kinase